MPAKVYNALHIGHSIEGNSEFDVQINDRYYHMMYPLQSDSLGFILTMK